MQQHRGNTQPAIDQEEHATIGGVNGKKVFVIDDAGNQITSFGGNATLNASPNYIGLVSVSGFQNPMPVSFAGNVTLDDGSLTALVESTAYIGLASVNVGGILPPLSAGVANIGFASITPVSAWPDPKTYIGLVTVANTVPVTFAGNVTLDDGSKTAIIGNVTLSDSKGFIGLATVLSLNVGTTKTLIHKNIELSSSSIATIAIPTGENAIFNITNLLISANATVRVSIKSG